MAKQTEGCVKEFLESLLCSTEFNVKQKQLEAVDSILRGKDTLCVLLTGYSMGRASSIKCYQFVLKSFTKSRNQ